jgi:hypothetical protein
VASNLIPSQIFGSISNDILPVSISFKHLPYPIDQANYTGSTNYANQSRNENREKDKHPELKAQYPCVVAKHGIWGIAMNDSIYTF